MPSDDTIKGMVRSISEKGWIPVPLYWGDKRPVDDKWNEKEYHDPKDLIREWEKNRYNVGVITGERSGNLVDVDLDSMDAVRLAPRFLPKTGCRFGRSSKPNSHYMYILTSSEARTEKFKDPLHKDSGENPTIVEFRFNDHQTMFPPSRHDSGQDVRFEERCGIDAIEEIAPLELREKVARLASAVLIGRHWGEGGRHDSAMALAGMLYRMKWTEEDVILFMEAVCDVSGDHEKRDRVRSVKDTIKRAERGGTYMGATKLKEYIPEEIVDRVRSFLTTSDGAAIDDMNEQYAMVLLGSKVAIMKRTKDTMYDRDRMDFMALADFRAWLSNKFVMTSSGDKTKAVPMSEYWMKSKGRLTYDQVVFSPEGDVPGALNLWQGFPLEPKKGDCSLFLDHVRRNICRYEDELYDWVMNFMADMFQRPAKRPGVALVLRGKQGTGKGIFARQIMDLTYPHSIQVSHARHLVGNFNSHLRDVLFVFADEAFYAGDKSHAGVLRGMITEPDINIELKGKDVFSVRNYIRLVIASNERWVVPAGMDERRFAVLDVGEEDKQNRDFFGDMLNQMDNGGREALMYELLERDITNMSMKIPQTAALAEQKVITASPIEQWFLTRLIEGDIAPRAMGNMKIPESVAWPDWIVKDAMYEDYLSTTQDSGIYRRGQIIQFWTELRSIMGGGIEESIRTVYMDDSSNGIPNSIKARKTSVKLPSLEVCRKEFCNRMGTGIKWPEEIEEQEEEY